MTDPDHRALPRLAAPARRALAAADITTIDDLAERRADEVASLHGMGPAALGVLRAALADAGASFRDEGEDREVLPPDVVAYVDALGPDHRQLFERLQALVLEVVPDARVSLSYGIPLYHGPGGHVGLNAGRRAGVTLTTTSPDHVEGFVADHPDVGHGKASLQFDLGADLDADAIRAVVRRATSPHE